MNCTNGRGIFDFVNPDKYRYPTQEEDMTRRDVLALVAGVALVLGTTPLLHAHPGHDQKVMGTVTMTAADHVMLKTPQGKDMTVQINAATKFTRAKKAMKAADMKVGMRIVISAVTDEDDDKLIAKVIELGPAPATK